MPQNHAKLENMVKKKLEQGISDFKKFIDKNCYFVDKTHLIKHLIEHPSEVQLITRPRRFGKTLNLSMIRYFFEAPPPGDSGTPNASLFDGLSISSHAECLEYMGRYPVIHLSFKDAKGSSFDECMGIIRDMLSAEYQRHEYLHNYGCLNEEEQGLFTEIIHKKGTVQNYASSIKYLSSWLKRIYNKPVYILLDEYDTPLHVAYTGKFYDEMIAFIRSFMVQTFKDNPNLMQAVVIGILKVAQESIFSDFNNPAVSTLLNDSMKDCFGFTEAEVESMAKYFGQESAMDDIRRWYNGYIFGGDTVIYNPWSLVSYLRNIRDGLQPYWVNTSDNRLVREVLQMENQESVETISCLLRGKEVRKELHFNIIYPEITRNPEVAWSFLLHGGYLKATDRRQIRTNITYNLSIPNMEVEYIYNKIIQSWLNDELKIRPDFLAFIRGVRERDSRLLELSLGEMLKNLASFHDMSSAGKGEEKSGEMFYHGLVLGLLAYLGGEYMVDSNREYGTGRADILLLKRAGQGIRTEDALLFEFKHESADKNTPLEKLAQEAHAQAVEKYLEGVKSRWNPVNYLTLGLGFRGKELAVEVSSGSPKE